jgi:hypothetical protein
MHCRGITTVPRDMSLNNSAAHADVPAAALVLRRRNARPRSEISSLSFLLGFVGFTVTTIPE